MGDAAGPGWLGLCCFWSAVCLCRRRMPQAGPLAPGPIRPRAPQALKPGAPHGPLWPLRPWALCVSCGSVRFSLFSQSVLEALIAGSVDCSSNDFYILLCKLNVNNTGSLGNLSEKLPQSSLQILRMLMWAVIKAGMSTTTTIGQCFP